MKEIQVFTILGWENSNPEPFVIGTYISEVEAFDDIEYFKRTFENMKIVNDFLVLRD